MKKVLFLMFLLFLIGLGTAYVNAQVRIGGNSAPNASTILDLNADGTSSTGTKGLALPRVILTSDTMQLTTGVPNTNGMLVYNNSVNLGARGMYIWNGSAGRWTLASLPNVSAADSGRVLMSNGTTWIAAPVRTTARDTVANLNLKSAALPVNFSLILDTNFNPVIPAWHTASVLIPGLLSGDWCHSATVNGQVLVWVTTNRIDMYSALGWPFNGALGLRIRCFRVSV